jgi:hypothetical protein
VDLAAMMSLMVEKVSDGNGQLLYFPVWIMEVAECLAPEVVRRGAKKKSLNPAALFDSRLPERCKIAG